MKLKSFSKIQTQDRDDIANYLYGMLTLPRYRLADVPYNPTKGDTSFWTIDNGNDWKLKFESDNFTFVIYHRYEKNESVQQYMKIMAEWLLRFGYELVTE